MWTFFGNWCRSRSIFIEKDQCGYKGVSVGIMFLRSYLVYILLEEYLGWYVLSRGSIDILAAVLDVCSFHHVARDGMPTIAWMLGMGLERKAPMDRRIPVLCIVSSEFKWETLAVENKGVP
jgi:hypothetical protein